MSAFPDHFAKAFEVVLVLAASGMVNCWLWRKQTVLITVDKSIPYQQNLKGRSIALLILDVPSNKLPDLLTHVSTCLSALRSIKLGQVMRLP